MAQITGSRTEFMTSDAGVSDIEYKRRGGCFLSNKKIVIVIFTLGIGLIAAGIIGAYFSPWNSRPPTTVTIDVEDEIEGIVTPAKFSVSSSILPTLYDIELIPVVENGTVKKLKGRVMVRFSSNDTKPLSKLVLNAKNLTVSKCKLYSHDDETVLQSNSAHSRKKRDASSSSSSTVKNLNSTDATTAANIAEVTITTAASGIGAASQSSTNSVGVLNATTMVTANRTASNLSSTETVTTSHTSPTTIANVITSTNRSSSKKGGDGVSTTSASVPTTSVHGITTPVPMYTTGTPAQSTEVSIINNETDTADSFYVIYPDTPMKRGVYTVEITYEVQVDGENTFSNVYDLDGHTRWLLASRLKPLAARTLFPNFDTPNSTKARLSLSLGRPDTLIALANMPLQSTKPLSKGWVIDRFQESPPLSSHELAFVVGDLQPVKDTTMSGSEVPITLWDRSNRANETNFIVEKIANVTDDLNQLFSTPYSMQKLDLVAVPGLLADGVGSVGLAFTREPLLYLSEKSSAISKKLAIENLVKLIAGQWLGGFVSPRTFSDSWFMEGSLLYLQHLLADKIDQTVDTSESFAIVQHSALEADSYDVTNSLETKFSSLNLEATHLQNVYKKGACLIRMLHNLISDSGFRNGYKNFLSRWMNSSAGVSDFWEAMSGEKADWLPNGVSLTEVMTPWVTQGGFPVVTVTRNYGSGSALIRQEQFAYDNCTVSNRRLWHIPLTYVNEGDDWSSPIKSWLKNEEKLTLEEVGKRGKKKWVLFNVNKTGYYRVNYDSDNWNLLSSALNSTFKRFPVTTRTSLVDDALSLAWGGRLGYPTALNLIRYLREKETHHSPWTVALSNMIKINNLLYNTPAYSSFQEFMIKFISPLLKKVTTTTQETQIKLMAIRWACLIDNPECRSYVKNISTAPAHLEETYHCTLAKLGARSEFESIISRTLNATDKGDKLKLLKALPCSRVGWILQSLLEDILKGEKFDESESLALLESFGENPTAAKSTFEFLRRHWNDVFQRFSKSYSISRAFLIAAMNGITDDQDLKDIFKEQYYENLKFMGHTIAVGEAEARSRSSWLKTNLVTVKSWLDDYIERTS